MILIQPKGNGFVVVFDRVEYPVCDKGYLLNFKDWNVHWQDSMLNALGIKYTDEHASVIDCIQEYRKKHVIPPMLRVLAKLVGIPPNSIINMFGGIAGNAYKIAGMPSSSSG